MLGALDYLNIGVTGASVLALAYVVYQSLLVRRTLAAGDYRRHALGMGIVAALVATNQVSNFIPSGQLWDFVGLAAFAAFSLGLLYWVDSSVIAAKRSDPLYRDTLRWSLLRRILWGGSALAFAYVLVLNVIFTSPGAGGASGEFPVWLEIAFALGFFFPIYSAAISAVVVIPIAARRCKDLVFRSHLEWFFLFVVIQLVMAGVIGQLFQNLSASGNSFSPISSLIDGVGLLIGFYPLYMSVRRLVPLYRFADEGGEGVGAPPMGAKEVPAR